MKKNIVLLLILVVSMAQTYGQTTRSKNEYLNKIKIFYGLLFSDHPVTINQCAPIFRTDFIAEYEEYTFYQDCGRNAIKNKDCAKRFKLHNSDSTSQSSFFERIKEQKKDLTQDITMHDIDIFITNRSEFLKVGSPDYVLIKISFPNNRAIYFNLNKSSVENLTIEDIYLPDGESFLNRIYPPTPNYLTLLGKINDPDGYVNIRKEPNPKSQIIGKIKIGDVFEYTPNSYSVWWNVRTAGPHFLEGYIYYNKIIQSRK